MVRKNRRLKVMKTSEVARDLGVDPRTVLRWAETRKLRARSLGRPNRFDRQAVEKFAAAQAEPVHHAEVLNTKQVAKLFGARPQSVIAWVKKGDLPEVERNSAGHRRFDRKEMEAIAATRAKGLARTDEMFCTEMSTAEVANLLGVYPKTVVRWVNKRILASTGKTSSGHRRFERKVVEAFAAAIVDGMSTTEAAHLIGTTRQTILNWIQAGILSDIGRTPTGHRRLDRKEVEAIADTYKIEKSNR